MRSILKRTFAEVEGNPWDSSSSSSPSSRSSPASSDWESEGEGIALEDQGFTPRSPPSPTSLPIRSILKAPKLTKGQSNVRFDQVTVFTFRRCQGFTSVPSHGGATLGMARRHTAFQRYTLTEHALEQRHRRRQRRKDKLREERFEAFKRKLITSGVVDQQDADRLTVDQVPDEDVDIRISDGELADDGFLQPFSSKQRQAILHAAGVKLIDREEKRQLHALRLSRAACGCNCQGFCEPETCACSLAGIKCQVDRFRFPCECTKDNCGNTQGHIQFDAKRAQTHYIHTVMRLELERQQQNETLSPEDQAALPEEFHEEEVQDNVPLEQKAQDPKCPFGFALEEDGFSLTMPATPSFQFIPKRLAVEENSCSSDMTDSSCFSSDSDTAGFLGENQNLPEVDGGLASALSLCDSKNNGYTSCNHRMHTREPLMQTSSSPATHTTTTNSMGARTAVAFTDNMSRTAVTDYLDENANQSRDVFEEDSLEDFPNMPSPTLDYPLGRYMDLSLSSDSDLEFFNSDYPSGPLHSSFKERRCPDSFQHLQLFGSVSLPEYESSTHLLESLIGLTDPSSETPDPQLL
ncbi:cysteine/serine-rich nuclear protein 1-like [Xenentodon cancila]